ncbi:MAG: hypothetical protein HYU41_00885 [Candidatus Rokubacteria bacterium]|nr:hypothetical protein [Candidatus Rokubacteria bacterium]
MNSGRARRLLAGALGCLLLLVAPAPAQEIVQAVVLDLTVLEVQVIVAAARADDRVRCVVRSGDARARTVVERAVGTGLSSGRTTMLSLPLPLLAADEREFTVHLVRDGDVVARTAWRALR